MSHVTFRNYAALFFTSLAAFLIALFAFKIFTENSSPSKVIESIGSPFKICQGYEIVKPGHVVCYVIHYFKYVDIPGDITKQLIIQPNDGSLEVYLPLGDSAGHLPVGEVKKKGYALIPDYVPEGKAKIKLSSSYHIGNRPYYDTAFTKEFEVRK
jgi:hypothetical protein